jgi:hypothetical protein
VPGGFHVWFGHAIGRTAPFEEMAAAVSLACTSAHTIELATAHLNHVHAGNASQRPRLRGLNDCDGVADLHPVGLVRRPREIGRGDMKRPVALLNVAHQLVRLIAAYERFDGRAVPSRRPS